MFLFNLAGTKSYSLRRACALDFLLPTSHWGERALADAQEQSVPVKLQAEVKEFAQGHMETKLDTFISDLEMMLQNLEKQKINLIS